MNLFLKFILAFCLLFCACRGGEPKILVLVIASDDQPVYRESQRVWRSYMHLDPEHVEAYFIKGNPDLSAPYQVEGDVIWCKTVENLAPGVLNKTLLSLECMLPRLQEFDYVLRTNLSSFYIFPRLLNFVETLPRSQCYCGLLYYFPWVAWASGAGFLLSPDLAEMLVVRKNELIDVYPDDMAIGLFFQNEEIGITHAPRTDFLSLDDWSLYQDSIASDAFHFRVKNNDPARRFTDEIYIQSELVKKFYYSNVNDKTN